jgi:hypothetical protein
MAVRQRAQARRDPSRRGAAGGTRRPGSCRRPCPRRSCRRQRHRSLPAGWWAPAHGHPAHVRGGDEACEVAGHAAADGDDAAARPNRSASMRSVSAAHVSRVLCRLAVGKRQQFRVESGALRMAPGQRSPEQLRDGIGRDDGVPVGRTALAVRRAASRLMRRRTRRPAMTTSYSATAAAVAEWSRTIHQPARCPERRSRPVPTRLSSTSHSTSEVSVPASSKRRRSLVAACRARDRVDVGQRRRVAEFLGAAAHAVRQATDHARASARGRSRSRCR